MKPPLKTAKGYQNACPSCNATKSWDYSTNGDGSVVQICVRCGHIIPCGRQYQDHAVGVRLIAYSMLSALVTGTTEPDELSS